MERLFELAYPFLTDALAKRHIVAFEDASIIVKWVAKTRVPELAATLTKQQWSRHCNLCASELLAKAQKAGEAEFIELDCGTPLEPIYTGEVIDSATHRLTARQIGTAVLYEFDKLKHRPQQLWVLPRSIETVARCHRDGGRSEFISGRRIVNSLFVKCRTSSSPEMQRIADQWEPLPLHHSMEDYFNSYGGDARITLLDGVVVDICSPFFLEIESREKSAELFFDGLLSRLEGQRFFLCSPFGFCKFKKGHNRWPWE